MAYYEEKRQVTCTACCKTNHIIIGYAGDGRANQDREFADCAFCNHQKIDSEKCFAIWSGKTPEDVRAQVTAFQKGIRTA